MSALANLPQRAIELVVTLLLPILLPHTGNDVDAATNLALDMLAEYNPTSIQELRAAGKIIGLSLECLQSLAEAAEPGLSPARVATLRRSACTLSRAEQQAEKALKEVRNNRPAEQPRAPQEPAQINDEPTVPGTDSEEKAYNSAVKLLSLMKAHHKGAPPPHSQAAQQIQAQQRVVDTARMKLEQTRRQQQAAAAVQEAA